MIGGPYLALDHRFGNVFARVVRITRLGRTSMVLKIAPAAAEKIGMEFIKLADLARKKAKKHRKDT